jgi:hypothetical protein
MRHRVQICSVLLVAALLPSIPAESQESWKALAAAAAAHTNALFSPVLESELATVGGSTAMPDDVAANCDEAGLPNGVRVFVADLYVPKSLAIAGAGNNCIVHPSSRTSIAGFATFNSPWFPMSTVGPTAPSFRQCVLLASAWSKVSRARAS